MVNATLLAAFYELQEEAVKLRYKINATAADLATDEENVALMQSSREIYMLIVGGIMCCLGSAGFAFQELGNTGTRHTKHGLLKCMLSRTAGLLAFWVIGGAWALGVNSSRANSMAGNSGYLLLGNMYTSDPADGLNYALWFLEASMCQLSISILSGAPGERATLLAAIVLGVVMSTLTVPMIQHWANHQDGWAFAPYDDDGSNGSRVGTLRQPSDISSADLLAGCGVIDLGSAVMHVAGGATALVTCMVLGPRLGKYGADGTVNEMRRQSITIQVMGVFSMWTAFMTLIPTVATYLGGSAHVGAKAVVNFAIASGAGGVTATITGLLVLNHADVLTAMLGIVASTASIFSCAHVVEPEGAFLIGLTTPPVYFFFCHHLDYWRIDDALDSAAVHLGGGLWGIICAGLLASPAAYQQAYGAVRAEKCCGALYGCGGRQLAAQVAWGLASTLWAGGVGTVVVVALKFFKQLRVSESAEVNGTDMLLHGGAEVQEHASVLMQLMNGDVSLDGSARPSGDALFSDRKNDEDIDKAASVASSRHSRAISRSTSIKSMRLRQSSAGSDTDLGENSNMSSQDFAKRAEGGLAQKKSFSRADSKSSASANGSVDGNKA